MICRSASASDSASAPGALSSRCGSRLGTTGEAAAAAALRRRRCGSRRRRLEHDVRGADQVAVAQHQRALHHVLELAHVARPVVGQQQLRGVGQQRRNARTGLAVCAPAGASPAAARRRGASAAAAASAETRSGGNTDPRGSARRRLRSRRRRLVVARTRTSSADRLLCAEALDLALLQHAQQLGLQRQRDLGDLIQQQACRPAPARTCRHAPPARR